MTDQVRVLRVLEYVGPRANVEKTLAQNAVVKFRDFGNVTIRESIVGDGNAETLPATNELYEVRRARAVRELEQAVKQAQACGVDMSETVWIAARVHAKRVHDDQPIPTYPGRATGSVGDKLRTAVERNDYLAKEQAALKQQAQSTADKCRAAMDAAGEACGVADLPEGVFAIRNLNGADDKPVCTADAKARPDYSAYGLVGVRSKCQCYSCRAVRDL